MLLITIATCFHYLFRSAHVCAVGVRVRSADRDGGGSPNPDLRGEGVSAPRRPPVVDGQPTAHPRCAGWRLFCYYPLSPTLICTVYAPEIESFSVIYFFYKYLLVMLILLRLPKRLVYYERYRLYCRQKSWKNHAICY